MKARVFLLAATVSFLFSGCGSGNSAPPPPSQFTIGGSVANLAGSNGGLQLQDNGGDTLSVNVNGSFMFSTPVPAGSAYDVTVSAQPANPGQKCEVTNGTGTATANVTSVMVDCGHGEWTWIGGSNIANQAGIYGTLGTPAAANIPGGRAAAAKWMDKSGNVWLFGGFGYDSAGTEGNLSGLWKYSGGQWTWMGGPDLANQPGTYGTLGTASPSNIPGGRQGPLRWTDSSGNFWLFGGYGYDSAGTLGELNDLWKYSAGQWTWMGGSNIANQKGTYGTLGTPSAANTPGARDRAITWTDASGGVWLFGGEGYDSAGTDDTLNDLWKYSAGQWTWVGGSDLASQKGIYGALGTASASNIPGARVAAVTWTDASGNVWLLGGEGYDSAGTDDTLNDLWKYSAGQWTWVGGSDLASQKGIYGALGTASASNIPGARVAAVTWTDASGNVWLLGGEGYDSAGTGGALNDLWKYSAGQWTWVGGSDLANQQGVYGIQGIPSAGNIPGGRYGSAILTDASGNVWLFGGNGYDSAGTDDTLNDLWKYSAGQWTWMGGSDLANRSGTYGTLGTPNPSNIPGARRYPAAWIDAQGNLWLFDGHGYDSAGTFGQLNGLWKYEP